MHGAGDVESFSVVLRNTHCPFHEQIIT